MLALQNAPADLVPRAAPLTAGGGTPAPKFDLTLEPWPRSSAASRPTDADRLRVRSDHGALFDGASASTRLARHFHAPGRDGGCAGAPVAECRCSPRPSERHHPVASGATPAPKPGEPAARGLPAPLFEARRRRRTRGRRCSGGGRAGHVPLISTPQANRVAARLRRQGVGPEVRSASAPATLAGAVVGMLAAWKAGGAYCAARSRPIRRSAWPTCSRTRGARWC